MSSFRQISPIQFKKFLDFIVYGNLLIGLGAYALSKYFIEALHLESQNGEHLSLFLFAATTFTYNFHRRIGKELYPSKVLSASVDWMINHPVISRLLTLISFLLSLFFLMELPRQTIWLIAPISILSLLYVMKVSVQRPLRSIPLLKVFLIAAVWTMATIYLVILNFSLEFQSDFHLLALTLFLFMIAQIIPFDIRDIAIDKNDDVQTLPSQLGIRSSINLSLLLLFASNLMLLFYFQFQLDSYSTPIFLPWLISSIYLAICLLYSRKKREDLYYSLIVEISLLLPWCFTQLLEVS